MKCENCPFCACTWYDADCECHCEALNCSNDDIPEKEKGEQE